MKVERAFERLSESAVLFSESLCKCFQRQQQQCGLWFLLLMAVRKFTTLFSGFLSTYMPGFHKAWYIFEISTVEKKVTLHKGILCSRSAHRGAFSPLCPILTKLKVIVLLPKRTGEVFNYFFFFFSSGFQHKHI